MLGILKPMPYEDWWQAAELLDQSWVPPTKCQLELTARLNMPLTGDEPFAVWSQRCSKTDYVRRFMGRPATSDRRTD